MNSISIERKPCGFQKLVQKLLIIAVSKNSVFGNIFCTYPLIILIGEVVSRCSISGQALYQYHTNIRTSSGQALVSIYKHNKQLKNNINFNKLDQPKNKNEVIDSIGMQQQTTG